MRVSILDISKVIDYAILKPDTTPNDVEKACRTSAKCRFHALCVNTCYVKLASNFLRGSVVKVCAAISFPFGASSIKAKAFEVASAVEDGADEVDVVANVGFIKSRDWKSFREEVEQIIRAAKGVVVKIIIEVGYLSEEEIVQCCEILAEIGVDFVKTCTGYGPRGVKREDVELLKKACRGKVKVKAAGGVRNLGQVLELLEVGADRIGTSNGPAIIEEFARQEVD